LAKKKKFEFNLLPPKSKILIKREDKRSYGLFYAAFLLFLIALVWVLISLWNFWLTSREVRKWENTDQEREEEIFSYNNVAQDNHELFQKANVLSAVVLKHTDPDLVFKLIDERIRLSTPRVDIVKYGRNTSGSYQITGTTLNSEDVTKLLKDFDEEENVEDVNLIIMRHENEAIEFILDLEINESETEDQTE